MIQLFSIRMIRPVGFGYKDDNHVFVLIQKTTGGNMYHSKGEGVGGSAMQGHRAESIDALRRGGGHNFFTMVLRNL